MSSNKIDNLWAWLNRTSPVPSLMFTCTFIFCLENLQGKFGKRLIKKPKSLLTFSIEFLRRMQDAAQENIFINNIP